MQDPRWEIVKSDRPVSVLRRVGFIDAKTRKRLRFNFDLSPLTIARLYKQHWRAKLFFKWPEQHLQIKTFYGTCENAVKTQIWTAVSIYVLLAIVKKRLGLEKSPYTILQILSVSLFEKEPIFAELSGDGFLLKEGEAEKQLGLFN